MEPAKYDPATGQPIGQPAYAVQGQPVQQAVPMAVPVQGAAVQGVAVQGAPVAMQMQHQKPVPAKLTPPGAGANTIERWGGGVFNCTEDCGGCILAWCCPCIVYGQNMEEAFGPQTHGCAMQGLIYCCMGFIPAAIGCPAMCWVLAYASRKQLDGKLAEQSEGTSPPETDINACCCHFWCTPCALSQETRAIRNWKKAGGVV